MREKTPVGVWGGDRLFLRITPHPQLPLNPQQPPLAILLNLNEFFSTVARESAGAVDDLPIAGICRVLKGNLQGLPWRLGGELKGDRISIQHQTADWSAIPRL